MADIIAVLHVATNDWPGILKLAKGVYTEGVYKNVTDYSSPDPDDVTFFGLYTLFDKAQTKVITKVGGKPDTATRDNLGNQMLVMLETKTLVYVNKLYRNYKEKLLLSGFPLKKENTTHSLRKKLVIKDIIDGPVAHSVRIRLVREKGGSKEPKESKLYTIYLSDDGSPDSFKPAGQASNSNKLFLYNQTSGKGQVAAVTVRNAAGENELSGGVRFYPK